MLGVLSETGLWCTAGYVSVVSVAVIVSVVNVAVIVSVNVTVVLA